MRFAERFAETSLWGALIRASIAWVLITPAVAAAKIWWSGTAFEDIPDTWFCPVCGARKRDFVLYEE